MSDLVPIERIRDARARAAGLVKVTPLELNATFSALTGKRLHLKLENLQKTGSFKVRGALNTLQLLDSDVRARGVITASAGNHGQGVAYAARLTGTAATVVMPEGAALSKIDATKAYGARVILAGHDYDEAFAAANDRAAAERLRFIHAFDDLDIIAGQGTLGLEILEQLPDVDTIVVPVGGGGLIAGVISAVRGLGSHARMVAVEPAGASSLAPSLRAGETITLSAVDTIADGLATRCIGQLPFAMTRTHIDAAVEADDDEIAAAVLLLLERAKVVVEGAGAAALAACLGGRLPRSSETVCVIVSGGNIDSNLLDRIISRGLVQQGRLFRFTTRLADRPGELQRLVECISACRANIHQIAHERARPELPLAQAAVTLELETRGPEHIAEIEAAVRHAGFAVYLR